MNHLKRVPKSKWGLLLVLITVGIVVGFVLSGDRQAAGGSMLLFLLLLACPIMMIFMMRGSKGDSHRHDDR